ncbi:hypothetical protein EV174_001243 [Coemansia sp. RSA 2320]|nr:hypothetical protein EV174_001243 [Coemansia sp. RSA 2320]
MATFIACGETGARLSVQDIECGAVDLSDRGLAFVLPRIALFATNITSLNLSNNALTSLPDEIGYLGCLQLIDVSYNQLEQLPATLAYCQSLHTIDASHNKLSGLPASLRHCQRLRDVILANNMLKSIPVGLCGLSSLESLNVSNNLIAALPAQMFMPGCIAATNRSRELLLSLDGCPIGQGMVEHIPAPRLVLSARFKYGVAAVDCSQSCHHLPKHCVPQGRRQVPALVDTVICKLANSNAPYPCELPDHLRERLDKLAVCDYCHMLYPIGAGVKRWRLIYRQKTVWPVEHSFCQDHWSDEKQRVALLFAPRKLKGAQPYAEARRAAQALAKYRISQTCRILCQETATPLSMLTSKLSTLTLFSNTPTAFSNHHKTFSSPRAAPVKHKFRKLFSGRLGKQRDPSQCLSGIVEAQPKDDGCGKWPPFLGVRSLGTAAASAKPKAASFTSAADTHDLAPLTVWQYYEGHVPVLPALPGR